MQHPYLLSVPSTQKDYYPPASTSERARTPFEDYEFARLQYMTFCCVPDRGIGITTGSWLADFEASLGKTIGARSGTATPDALVEKKKPSVKMSFADYSKLKKDGIKPNLKPVAKEVPQAESRNALHHRNTSATSASSLMAEDTLLGESRLDKFKKASNSTHETPDAGALSTKSRYARLLVHAV